MPEQHEQPFAAYLREVDTLLTGIPAQQREEIRRELLAHLEGAAQDQGLNPTDPTFQRQLITSLGSSLDLGTALYHVHQGENTMLKRLFDICLASLLLLLASPFLLILSILIKLDSPGPIFYRDTRLGRNGRVYTLYKFRSMVVSNGQTRITRLGHFMRKRSLDEIPQLWNVLKGDMSLVGPRPSKPEAAISDDPNWRRALLARPGLTGPAFVYAGPAPSTPQSQLEANLHYIEKQSWRYDLHLLGQTLRQLRKQ